jgi:uncharacterized protein YdhG (YjbR/CyaY superfamily)
LDDYFESLEPPKGDTLRAVIADVLAQFPELECKLSWNVPQIHRAGDFVFGVSAAKHHLSLSPWSTQVIADFGDRLDGFVVKKNLFQVPVDWEIDSALLRDLVAARLAELDAGTD